jgi:dUTP pyrophosphatase
MNTPVKVYIKKLSPLAIIPKYATEGAAAFDLNLLPSIHPAHGNENYVAIYPGDTITCSTGLAMEIPLGYVGLIMPRSGLGVRGLIIANGTGVIDSDYRGEILVSLYNRSKNMQKFKEGERIAQMLIVPVTEATFVEVAELGMTARGGGGFGSTGSNAI